MSNNTMPARIAGRGHHGYAQRQDIIPPRGISFEPGRFGRMFPELTTPLEPPDAALAELGAAMLDGPGGRDSGDNSSIPAGFTYLGQFIDHDVTLDTTTLTEVAQDPTAVENFRTPRLDLDSVYGFGPRAQPSLYDRFSPGRAKLLLGGTTQGNAEPIKAGLPHDLPRNSQGFAIIGDERNDENLLVAQTHVAFLRFHNAIVDRLAGTVPDGALFGAARRATIDLYQAMVIRDFLTKLCDPCDIEAALTRRRFFRFERFGKFGQPYIPIEFSVAAYRLGHSMVRSDYSHNRIFRPGGPVGASGTLDLLFQFTAKSGAIGTTGDGPANRPTLPGDWIIDWRRFLDFGTVDPADGFVLNLTRNIDPYLAEPLHRLFGVETPTADTRLSVMNLRRGVKMKLPAAQEVAQFMGVAVLSPDEIAAGGPDGDVARQHGLHVRTPLWYYILKEAELRQQGSRLGPLGSKIVAETFVGLLQGDPGSILARNPNWRFGQPLPGLVLDGADVSFTFADLVAVASGGRSKEQLSPIDDPANK
ncbi:MAG: heme peroxidase family protein [Acetobacteraceae bacterium]